MALKNLNIIDKEEVIAEFFDKYLSSSYSSFNCKIELMEKLFIETIELLFENKTDDFLKAHTKLAKTNIDFNIPYVVLVNELSHLQNIIVKKLIQKNLKDESLKIYEFYNKIENIVAKEYFDVYIQTLISTNHIRKSSLEDMVDKYIVEFYNDHINWLSNLALSIKSKNLDSFPELDHNMCDFGKWLNSEAKDIIKNNSKFKTIVKIHEKLHMIAYHIKSVIQTRNEEYHILLNYLEKCELISLAIGTELALIDNTIINQKASKDSLTGALGRQVLNQIFQNQYEISIATNNPLSLAICDLDYFKIVNDTHGHLAGDMMLKHFVNIVKKNLRSSDILIRYGGEEFIILLPATNKEQGYNILNKIREAFENSHIIFENKQIETTVSIGLTSVDIKDKFEINYLKENLAIADKNLYYAKHKGRNIVI